MGPQGLSEEPPLLRAKAELGEEAGLVPSRRMIRIEQVPRDLLLLHTGLWYIGQPHCKPGRGAYSKSLGRPSVKSRWMRLGVGTVWPWYLLPSTADP